MKTKKKKGNLSESAFLQQFKPTAQRIHKKGIIENVKKLRLGEAADKNDGFNVIERDLEKAVNATIEPRFHEKGKNINLNEINRVIASYGKLESLRIKRTKEQCGLGETEEIPSDDFGWRNPNYKQKFFPDPETIDNHETPSTAENQQKKLGFMHDVQGYDAVKWSAFKRGQYNELYLGKNDSHDQIDSNNDESEGITGHFYTRNMEKITKELEIKRKQREFHLNFRNENEERLNRVPKPKEQPFISSQLDSLDEFNKEFESAENRRMNSRITPLGKLQSIPSIPNTLGYRFKSSEFPYQHLKTNMLQKIT